MIERSHRTLNNMLRTMLLEKERREWSSLIPSIVLYMDSMIQEKTGVSAGEILFGRNPNLPSDISFTLVTSLSDDREGYVKQLKRDLQDIRQKLGRVLGQEPNQSSNPFSVGEKVIVAVLPHERADKLMAKWKGPFIVTSIPNRFQIEYMDDGVTRLTHISYVKKFNERNAPEAFSAPTAALAAGYGSPKAMEESPVSSAASPTSLISSIMQVRRYS